MLWSSDFAKQVFQILYQRRLYISAYVDHSPELSRFLCRFRIFHINLLFKVYFTTMESLYSILNYKFDSFIPDDSPDFNNI